MPQGRFILAVPLSRKRKVKLHRCQVTHEVGACCQYSRHDMTKSISTPPTPTLPLNEILVHRRVTSSIKFADTHLYIWVEGSTVRVKCHA